MNVRFLLYIITIAAVAGIFTIGCKKDKVTNTLAEVETNSAIVSDTDTVKVIARVISDNGTPVSERGICWSESGNPTLEDNKLIKGEGTGSFECIITGILPETEYHVRAFATNQAGTAYGTDITFMTHAPLILSEVETNSVNPTGPTSASVTANVTTDNGTPVTERGVVWNVAGNPTISDNKLVQGSGSGSFTCDITGLDPMTAYHVRAYAMNQAGTSYGNELILETPNSIVAMILDQPIILRTIDSVRRYPTFPECPDEIFAYPETLSMSIFIDVNNDGTNDYNFKLAHYNKECIYNSHCAGFNAYVHFLNVYRQDENCMFINKTNPFPRFFTHNDLIAYDSDNINGGHGALIKDTCEGDGESLDNVYMGIIINDMLGWIHIDIQNNFEVAIKGWAINTVPFAPIRAGQTE